MNTAIIVGAGKGTRMNSKINKILLTLVDKPLVCHTIEKFENCSEISQIILVINKENTNEISSIIKKYQYKKIKKIVEGGEKRQDSVYNGIKSIENAKDNDIILIHNAANPLVSEKTIIDSINNAKEHGACAVGILSKDTIREVEGGFALKTLDRKNLWLMQTPQAIKYSIAVEAFRKAYKDNYCATDDASLVERLGKKVKIISSNSDNIKITTKDDLEFANSLLINCRVGLGQDSHRFTNKKKPLVLGGVLIENEQGLEANSDGDVILHALFNAITQSIGKKSIGHYADPMLEKGVTDSKEYLKTALNMLEEEDYKLNNVGIMIEAKKPRIDNYEEKIKNSLSALLKISKNRIGITATSGEELTDFGKGLGIQVFAVTTIIKN